MMDINYNPHHIEAQAQQYWQKKQCFNVTEDLHKEKFYCLAMFPYPSGALHMGHVRNYTLADVIARYQRALGKNVLQPIGWDAFGLPAENAAIKSDTLPALWTKNNIAAMKKQILRLGNAYDWHRELTTCAPEYYRWEQWFFIKLHEKGLVYKKNSLVNWDPIDQTVLANEQVINGRGWRSGALIERKEISQWFIKITAYAEELLSGLDKLSNWPHQVIQMQRNWIGRSEGCEINFAVNGINKKLKIYTTRPETLMGVTYVAIAPEHNLAKEAAKLIPAVQNFINQCHGIKIAEADITTIEKQGIFTGYTAIHPITHAIVPIWIANFVLMQYSAGAIMGVPAHDQRDWEFAKKYDLTIKPVIIPPPPIVHDFTRSAFTADGTLIDSEQFTDLSSDGAKHDIVTYLVQHDLGKVTVNYRLRDWGVSRQRYWGTPIPMIICDDCGILPVPESQLPVLLPEIAHLTGTGSPLAQCNEFLFTKCPKCNQDAVRETDTLDTFVESSWYYARFACNDENNIMLDDRAKYWTPVDQYIGGIEHAVMHLLYARLFHKLMRDEGLVNSDEPFATLLTQGMVLKDGHKMSKSLGNIVDPDYLINTYGADTVRLFILFAAPPDQSLEWSDAGVEGAYRFLKRLWTFIYQKQQLIMQINEALINANNLPDWSNCTTKLKRARLIVHQILSQANLDYERSQFNTVISGVMKLFNELTAYDILTEEDQYFIHEGVGFLLRLLAPITPHICHHLWIELNFEKIIIDATWPKFDKTALKSEELEYVVQINGKLRAQLKIANGATESAIIDLAQQIVAPYLKGQQIKKAIVVNHRHLINLVIDSQ